MTVLTNPIQEYFNNDSKDPAILSRVIDKLFSNLSCLEAEMSCLEDLVRDYQDICGESSPDEIIDAALKEHNAMLTIADYAKPFDESIPF
jgi:hypothetical protein